MRNEKNAGYRMERRREAAREVFDGIETEGVPGLFKVVYRFIGQNQPSIDCVREAEQPFGADAPSGDEDASDIFADNTWDAALDFAACLKDALLDPEPPEPPEPTDPTTTPPTPPPHHHLKDSVADIVLAALLVRLRQSAKRGKDQGAIQMSRRPSESFA
jgi:hypothetical protein